jgi:hypothetical protein
MMRIAFFCLLLMFFFCCRTIFGQDALAKGFFNIYLLPDNIKASRLSELKIGRLKPKGKPFLSKRHE